MKVDELRGFMDELIAEGPVSVPKRVETVLQEANRLMAYATASVAELDTWGEYSADGAPNAKAWVATTGHLPNGEAGRMVKRGRAKNQIPRCWEAWRNGEITSAHFDVILKLRNPRTEDALDRDEEMLLDQARKLRFEHFVKSAACWEQMADPDGTEEAAEEKRNRRDAYLVPTLDGMYFGRMTLDPISGTILFNELDRLERALFEEEWEEAKMRLGFEPTVNDLSRTPGQRRVDAWVEMATRSRTAPEHGRRPDPLFSVLIDFPTLCGRTCELAQGIAITPGSLVPWLDRADFERAIFEPPDRVQVSETDRFFTGATRRGLELRDRQCTHPYCDRPAAICEADHIQPYSEGGLTIQENGRVLCGYHNRLRNQRPPLRE
ncbi:MAG TPA: DUF222 domain-containing protein [Acidimicrobiales bacterium]|nr:DUF222 domain-containing protein [Acidimicrobiales bacterium]